MDWVNPAFLRRHFFGSSVGRAAGRPQRGLPPGGGGARSRCPVVVHVNLFHFGTGTAAAAADAADRTAPTAG